MTETMAAAEQASERHSEAVVDAHHHLWDLDTGSYSWLQQPPFSDRGWGDWSSLRRNYLAEDYQADSADIHIAATVHIQVSHDLGFAEKETAWVSDVARRWGFPNAIVGYVDLESAEAEQQLQAQLRYPLVRGIRQVLSWHPDPRLNRATADHLTSPLWQRNFGLLEQYGLVFDAQVYPHQLAQLADLAECHAGIIVLDHCGLPAPDGSDRAHWLSGLRRLACSSNVSVKISGFGMAERKLDLHQARSVIADVIDTFGTDRVLFGSNFPVDSLHWRHRDLWALYRDAITDLADGQRHAMLSGNACRLYRIEPADSWGRSQTLTMAP